MDFFAVKKLVSYLVSPVPLGVLLLTFACLIVWLKKSSLWVRSSVTLAWCLLVIVPMSPLSSSWLEAYERLYPSYQPGEQSAVRQIVVLACYVSDDPDLPVTSQHHACSRGRLVEALRIWHLHSDAEILLSGGPMRFKQASMAQKGADFLMALGVPEGKLKVIDKGRDTNSEVIAIKQQLFESTPVLVTSGTHMKRAVRLFAKHGISVIPAPSEHLVLYSNHIERAPDWKGAIPTAASYYRSERAWYAMLANALVTLQSLWGDETAEEVERGSLLKVSSEEQSDSDLPQQSQEHQPSNQGANEPNPED